MKHTPLVSNRYAISLSGLLLGVALSAPLAYGQMMGGGMMGGGMGQGMMGGGMQRYRSNNEPPQTATRHSDKAREFAQSCSGCHALPSPELHTAAQWPQVVKRMEYNMSSMGWPQPDQRTLHDVLEYLEAHAADRH